MQTIFLFISALTLVTVFLLQLVWQPIVWSLVIILPGILIGIIDILQNAHSIRKNFPLIGRMRWLMESIRPFIRQYLLESETDGTPISRMFRSIIYQRAKGDLATTPLGTKFDTSKLGYEWISHSLAAFHISKLQAVPRVLIGGTDCKKPYSASLLNISAMSFGALSNNAISALNGGAKKGGFYHNTGEGGVSPYHLQASGDLVWQIGTGYFGCRTSKGTFCHKTFTEVACKDSVKMIEIKMSQGAKPGHGGILPGVKNTPEIAKIRHLEAYTTVDSPPSHSAFSTPLEMMNFIQNCEACRAENPSDLSYALEDLVNLSRYARL